MNKPSPSDIVQQLLAGEESAVDDVLAMYSDDVLRLCMLIMRNRDDAQEIWQETFLRFVQMLRKKRLRTNNGSIKALLLQIARNACIDRLRVKNRWAPLHEDADNFMPSLEPPPDHVSEDRRFEEAFERALDQLSGIQRTILVLHDVQGEPYEAIANLLGITQNNVRTNIWRAREVLRKILEPYIKK
ncbi:RNA polymerase sigma factor [bacterium]|nr:RNA polymerase sigma factor [bacterium]